VRKSKKSLAKLKNLWPIALITFLVIIFFWKFFFRGLLPIPADITVGMYFPWLDYKWGYAVGVPVKNHLLSDVVSVMYPFRTYAAEVIKNGYLPLWNSLSFSGAPLLATFQSAILYPLNLFYFLLSPAKAWSLEIIFQPLLAALFTYLFLRNLKINKIASLTGGIIYAFSGFSIIWLEYNVHGHTSAYIPLLFYSIDRYFKDRRWGLLFPIGLGLQIFAGYPQVTIYAILSAVAYFLFRLSEKKNNYQKFFSLSFKFALFLVLGLCLAASQLLPGIELFRQSQRSIEVIGPGGPLVYLPWQRLVTFIAPDFFGNPATGNSWGVGDYTSVIGYSGVLSLITTTLAIVWIKRKEVKFFLGLLLVALLFTLESPIAALVNQLGILGAGAASTIRILVLANFSLAVLAALGLDLLNSKRKSFKSAFKIGFIFLLVISGIFIGVFASRQIISRSLPEFVEGPGLELINKWLINLRVGLRNLILPLGLTSLATMVLWLLRIKFLRKFLTLIYIFFLIFELFRFGWKYLPFISQNLLFPTTPAIDFLKDQEPPFRILGGDAMPMNMWAAYNLESLAGYDAVYPLRYAKFLAVVNGGRVDEPLNRYGDVQDFKSPLLNLGNVKYILAVKRDEQETPDSKGKVSYKLRFSKFKPAFDDKSVRVLENKEVLPRAFMVYRYRKVSEEAEIINNLLSSDFDFTQEIILEKEIDNKLITGEVKEVSYERNKNNSSIVTIDHSGDGLLFISDSFYPGWKAFIDGKETKIYRANYAFRAVFLPSGKHTVRFIYDPLSFKIGTAISLIALVVLGGLFVYETKNRRRTPPKRSP